MVRAIASRAFLAYLLVSALVAAVVLPFVLPVLLRWLQLFRSSRLRAMLSAVLLLAFVYVGGSLDKRGPMTLPQPESRTEETGPSLRSGDSSMYPPWYIDLGYPTTDTDGDGIPDYWERRTRTDRFVADAADDPDGDGVDNAEEFWYECDPLVKDTDGDGLSDREEIDGAVAGRIGFDPLSRCDYPVNASDAAAWEGTGRIVPFAGVNGGGLPLNVGYSDEAEDNVDVLLTVDSTRYAELTWEDETQTKRLLLPPCTNLVLRLRVSAVEASSVALSAAPGATGLWKAALRAEWDVRRGLSVERKRIQSGSGWLVDLSDAETVFAGVLPGTLEGEDEPMRAQAPRRLRSVQNAPPLSIAMVPRRAFGVEMSPTCRLHGPLPVFTGTFTNAVPPFFWTVNGQNFTTDLPELNVLFLAEEYRVGCFDSGAYSQLPLGTDCVFHIGQCQNGPETNFIGACWTSTHNPTNADDHLPHVEEKIVSYAPLCPVYTNTIVHAGWTHDTVLLWLRNLVRKVTGKPDDDDTDHCINVSWTENGSIDLWSFLDPSCLLYTNALSIRVWESDGISGPPLDSLSMGNCPSEMLPTVRNVLLCDADGTEVYDRFWLVISSPVDRAAFDEWYDQNSTDLTWTGLIPCPPSHLDITTNSEGETVATIPTPFTDHSSWSTPKPFKPSEHMHHDAKYEMRTETVDLHGNQATYDAHGNLITATIAAGTSDYYQPYDFFGKPRWDPEHRDTDVYPYVRALQLDGNPGIPAPKWWIPRNISHPCIYQGQTLERYLYCRPCIH